MIKDQMCTERQMKNLSFLIDIKDASMSWVDGFPEINCGTGTPAYTVGDLIDKLPIEIDYKKSKYVLNYNNKNALYENIFNKEVVFCFRKETLIENLYQCYKWLVEEKVIVKV